MTSAFAREWLERSRPASVLGPAGVSLPRRVSYHPSPVDWRDEVLYFLLVDRFSDGREETAGLCSTAPASAITGQGNGAGMHGLSQAATAGRAAR
jgi:hypothetical protein